MLRYVKKIFKQTSSLKYWDKRAASFGERSVINMGYTQNVDEITAYQIEKIFPYIKPFLSGAEKLALDFGCGAGRFTPHIAALINGECVGVDPTKQLVEIAKLKNKNNQFQLFNGKKLNGIKDGCIDLLWICLVMGGIKEKEIKKIVKELKRVLAAEGVIVLIENISKLEDSAHWQYRNEAFYSTIFGDVILDKVSMYKELDEDIGIFIGRKKIIA